MIWDGLIVYFAIAFAIAGWNVGFSRAWPTIIAVALATLTTQTVYMTLSCLMVEQIRIQPDWAVFISYLACWLGVEIFFEVFLVGSFGRPFQNKSLFWLDRLAGSGLALGKGVIVLVFAALATATSGAIASPPRYDSAAFWLADSAGQSNLIRGSYWLATRLPSSVERHVISMEPPGHQPDFSAHVDNSSVEIQQRIRRIKQLMQDLQDFQ